MKPLLYPKNTTDFSTNGLGFLPDGISCKVTETINAKFELELVYPASGANFENIGLNSIILCPINNYAKERAKWQPFRVYKHTKILNGSVTFYAEHISYLTNGYVALPNDDYIETEGTAASFMSYLTSEAANAIGVWNFAFSTDVSKSEKWSIQTPLTLHDAMAKAVKIFGGEWEYNRTSCVLRTQRGQNRGTVVQYGSNMVSLSQDYYDEAYTHIMPYWTDGTDTVYVSGQYMAVQSVTSDVEPKIKIVNLSDRFDDKPTPSELYDEAVTCDDYLIAAIPSTSIQAQFVDRGQTSEYAYLSIDDHVELGDTVTVKARNINVSTTARCNQLVYEVYKERYLTATLGVIKSTITASVTASQEKRSCTVWVSIDAPKENYQSGDYWIKINNNVDRVAQSLGRYGGGSWKLLCKFAVGGVGENVGKHNERFNQYGKTYNKITDSTPTVAGMHDYNHVEGYQNTIADGNNTHVEGRDNTFTNGYNGHVEGYKNTVTNSGYNHVEGSENTVSDSSNYAFVGGEKNVVTRGPTCIVHGYQNTVQTANRSIITGERNNCQKLYDSIICGYRNNVGDSNSGINRFIGTGQQNTITGQRFNGMFCGESNIITSDSSVTCGVYNQNSVNHSMLCGIGGITNNSIYFAVGNGSQSTPRNVFYIEGTGNVYAAGAYNTIGADYAEYFEWSDGNPDNEFRVGMLVMLDGDKIRPAHGDDILGVVSAAPSVVSNAAELHFRGKYVTDVYGRVITTTNGEPLISPDYDPRKEYIPRSKRKEWAAVGLVGRLVVRDDGTCVPGEFVAARNGEAVASLHKTRIKVLRRVDELHVEVLIK